MEIGRTPFPLWEMKIMNPETDNTRKAKEWQSLIIKPQKQEEDF
jgi:hypothetical protein